MKKYKCLDYLISNDKRGEKYLNIFILNVQKKVRFFVNLRKNNDWGTAGTPLRDIMNDHITWRLGERGVTSIRRDIIGL